MKIVKFNNGTYALKNELPWGSIIFYDTEKFGVYWMDFTEVAKHCQGNIEEIKTLRDKYISFEAEDKYTIIDE